ncbi:hypothetical protein [Novosphingobium resinovorum]|uniref:hypothetical protein n=1 Tax=Novosphingobium resinovorum TaxID=158500 RepID=UPI002ED34F46|nr:hypothetical protein [Novosphingobium resinovorum]
MDEPRDFLDEIYDPAAIMARIGHLPVQAQQEIEQISRIVRGAFGYGEGVMPEQGRIVRITLTGPCGDRQAKGSAIKGYDFQITVNLPECADDVHWRFARRLVASEIDTHLVNLTIDATGESIGIILYDAGTDFPLNARELSLRP